MMKIKKIVSFILMLTCMVCLGLSFGFKNVKTVQAQEPTVNFTKVDTEYNNSVWGGNTMAVGIYFDKNFTAKAYAHNDGGYDDPVIASVKGYTKINGQSGAIQLSFLVEENSTRIVFLYDITTLTVPEGQEYATFTIEAGAPFGGQYLPAVTLYLVDGEWKENKPVKESVTVTNIHNRAGTDQRLLLFISNSDYATANENLTDKITNSNVLDYVKVYTSETEYKTLRQIYQGNAQSKIWNEANSVGFQIDATYHGTAVYAVEIKKGAQFPASTNGYTTYVVSADVTFYNLDYNSTVADKQSFATAWTTAKPEIPDEPEIPTLGTPDVSFVELHKDNNNSVWGGTTRVLRLVFSENFNAKAYDGNDGGYDAPIIAHVRHFVKINGKPLGDVTFLQVENENSITFLYDESLLTVPCGQTQTIFTIEAGAPFGGHYLPQVTLYFNGENWQTEATSVEIKFVGVDDTQNNTSWNETQNSVRVKFNYCFYNEISNNINDSDGLRLISKLTFNGVPLTANNVAVFIEEVGGNSITIRYSKEILNWSFEEGSKYHTLTLTESVNYLGIDIPAFTLYLRNGAWVTERPQRIEIGDVETAVGYNSANVVHIRDWNLDGDETTSVNNMIVFFMPSGGFPAEHDIFLNLDKVAEYNVFDKIKLHMITPNADADADGFVTLGQVFNAGGWYPSSLTGGKDKIVVVNIWETENSFAFSMGTAYNAESFDYIIIEEGCEFPNYYYTNKLDNTDYVQNGDVVAYENLDKVSFIQTQTVKVYTNPADFHGPFENTNWAFDTNMGEISVSGVDYKDGFVIIKLEGSNYPMGADGDNLHQNVSAGNAPMALNMLADIYVNGISLYDRVVHFGGNGIIGYFNYCGYGNFAINVALVNANEVVNEIIVAKDLRVPIYGMSNMASAAYGVMYTETAETVSYTRGAQGFKKDANVYWTVIFDNGETVTKIKVANGEALGSNDIPETPTKAGYEFVGWVYGIDGMYSFEPTSQIKTSYYLTVNWSKTSESSSSTESEEGGCFGSFGSLDAMVALMLVAGVALFVKKKRA
ncbi:MAG: InlB B-repeat-containing protein [Clostridia bacterium]|nr:InlB B-repeat-containing protein [Clostridia bacterium]